MHTPKLGSVLIVLHRVGPYHHARFQAAASVLPCPLLVLQTRPQSQEYPWTFSVEGAAYTLLSLEGARSTEQDPPRSLLRSQLEAVLERYHPSVIVSVGWADLAYLCLLHLSQQRHIPLIVVSDSRKSDSARSPLKEWCKRYLLRGYSAAFVAGSQSLHYLLQLGIPRNSIYKPWDVVDNKLIAHCVAETRPSSLINTARPFLCVGRFISEKNHALLLKAFACYQLQGGKRSLLLVGHGPLKESIRKECAQLPHPSQVKMIPFVDFEQLAAHYGHAHSLVLASRKDTWGLVVNEAMAAGLPVIVSSACGCVDDLIEHTVTGWRFSSSGYVDLASCLFQADIQSVDERNRMTQAAHKRLSEFSLESFALGFKEACDYALAHPRYSIRSKILAYLLQMRH